MSNALAIAAVTRTIRKLIARNVHDLQDDRITTLPPDKARPANGSRDQLNLFLYQASTNAAWRNADLPRRAGHGDVGRPPLALNLFYLITAFGKDDDETLSHRWLGKAMSALHDHPLLGAEEIHDAMPDSELESQVERVRITPQSLTLEEMSKLWTTFQTQYRISAAYQVDVVLIESRLPSRSALPVLRRGQKDDGAEAVAGVSLPQIDEIRLPNRQSSVMPGDEIVIAGTHLDGVTELRFTLINPALPKVKPIVLAPQAGGTGSEVRVTLPDDAAAHAAWPAGFYSVAVRAPRGPQVWTSNELSLSLAPRIDAIAPGLALVRDGQTQVTLTITCSPEVRLAGEAASPRFAQQAALLLGTARQVPPQAPPSVAGTLPPGTNTLTFQFKVPDAEVGAYQLRLRVDGVDLAQVDRSVTPPVYDPRLKVTIS